MKIKRFIFIGLGFLTITACQKKEITAPLVIGADNSPNALVISGYGFNSAVFYLNPAASAGYYDTTLHETFIAANEDTDSIHLELHIRFAGESSFYSVDTVGVYTKGELYNATDSIMITSKNSQKVTYYSPVYIKNYLDIIGYDNVGGHIRGLISGDFVNSFNNKDTLKISSGRFSVVRLPDVD